MLSNSIYSIVISIDKNLNGNVSFSHWNGHLEGPTPTLRRDEPMQKCEIFVCATCNVFIELSFVLQFGVWNVLCPIVQMQTNANKCTLFLLMIRVYNWNIHFMIELFLNEKNKIKAKNVVSFHCPVLALYCIRFPFSIVFISHSL